MAKTLAELLADAAADDNMELSLPDGTKYKLSDVRGFRSGVETDRQAAINARKEAEKVVREAKDIFDALSAAKIELDKKNAPPPEPKGKRWQDNPLYDELVPVIEAAETAARESREMAKSLKSSLELSQATYVAERLRREWAEAKTKPKDKKFDEVVAEVLAAKEVDDLGLPTLQKYLHRSTEGDRMEAYAAEKIAAAKKDWEKARHMADIPKPGKFQTRKSAEAPIKKLEELTSDLIANDPDIPSLDGFVQ